MIPEDQMEKYNESALDSQELLNAIFQHMEPNSSDPIQFEIKNNEHSIHVTTRGEHIENIINENSEFDLINFLLRTKFIEEKSLAVTLMNETIKNQNKSQLYSKNVLTMFPKFHREISKIYAEYAFETFMRFIYFTDNDFQVIKTKVNENYNVTVLHKTITEMKELSREYTEKLLNYHHLLGITGASYEKIYVHQGQRDPSNKNLNWALNFKGIPVGAAQKLSKVHFKLNSELWPNVLMEFYRETENDSIELKVEGKIKLKPITNALNHNVITPTQTKAAINSNLARNEELENSLINVMRNINEKTGLLERDLNQLSVLELEDPVNDSKVTEIERNINELKVILAGLEKERRIINDERLQLITTVIELYSDVDKKEKTVLERKVNAINKTVDKFYVESNTIVNPVNAGNEKMSLKLNISRPVIHVSDYIKNDEVNAAIIMPNSFKEDPIFKKEILTEKEKENNDNNVIVEENKNRESIEPVFTVESNPIRSHNSNSMLSLTGNNSNEELDLNNENLDLNVTPIKFKRITKPGTQLMNKEHQFDLKETGPKLTHQQRNIKSENPTFDSLLKEMGYNPFTET